MKISHDGDRVSGAFFAGKGGALEYEHGDYACSTPRIDALCDLMNNTDGVWGSELAGAGLGGCVLILVDRAKTESIMKRLNEEFYDRNGLERSAFVCTPCDGSKIYY
jgi:galactokinase